MLKRLIPYLMLFLAGCLGLCLFTLRRELQTIACWITGGNILELSPHRFYVQCSSHFPRMKNWSTRLSMNIPINIQRDTRLFRKPGVTGHLFCPCQNRTVSVAGIICAGSAYLRMLGLSLFIAGNLASA